MCEGVQIHIKDAEKFSYILVVMNMLYKIKDIYPSYFSNKVNSDDFKYNFFNHLVGCDYVLSEDIDIVLDKFKINLKIFFKNIEKYYMY